VKPQGDLLTRHRRQAQRIVVAVVAVNPGKRQVARPALGGDRVDWIVLVREQRVEQRLGVERLMNVGQ
jgi:hypothetical protein